MCVFVVCVLQEHVAASSRQDAGAAVGGAVCLRHPHLRGQAADRYV